MLTVKIFILVDKWKKDKGLHYLGMPHYIAFGSHMYQGEKFRFLILQRFGLDLGKLFTKCKRKFHIKTVLTLGIQIVSCNFVIILLLLFTFTFALSY